MLPFRQLPGLPADGDRPLVAFPPDWATDGGEGLVVEFADGDNPPWIANFQKGPTVLSRVDIHPNGREFFVIAHGPLWVVDLQRRTAQQIWTGVEDVWHIQNPDRVVVHDGRTFVCLDAGGERWRTPALTQRAGFKDDLRLEGERVTGHAWAVLTQSWIPFRINLESGAVYGGGDGQLETRFDVTQVGGPEQAPALSSAAERQLAVIRNLRRAAFASLLAMPVVVAVLAAINKLARGSTAMFVSGAPWTNVFWSTLFYVMMAGVLLAMVTVSRRCPRCQNGFFVSKGYARHSQSTQSRGTVNVFARRCLNCELPLNPH